jgi:hypothetical protein
MFSPQLKKEISDLIQVFLQDTKHPELPLGEISFLLHVDGATDSSWANIRNESDRHIPAPQNLIKNTKLSR